MDDAAGAFIPSPFKPPALLPIARHRQSILYVVEKHPLTIIVGQTGSGKTINCRNISIRRDGVPAERQLLLPNLDGLQRPVLLPELQRSSDVN